MLSREAAGIRPTSKKNGHIILASWNRGDPSSDVAMYFLFLVGREYGIHACYSKERDLNFIWIYLSLDAETSYQYFIALIHLT